MIGDRIKKLRMQKQITQEELGKIIEVTTSMVGMYETNARKPSYEILDKLANYFQVTTDYLLGKSPFKDNKEAECSIRIAAMKAALNDPQYHDFIWNRALESTETGFGFTDRTMQYIKSLPTKGDLTNIDYYDLSLFVAWNTNWPKDFKGPTTLVLWETKISCDIDYWSIPRIVVEEHQSNIEYKEPNYDGPPDARSLEEIFCPATEKQAKLAKLVKLKKELDFTNQAIDEANKKIEEIDNRIIEVPIIGYVPAGEPLLSEETIIGYMPFPFKVLNDLGENIFCLQIHGDSMIEMDINNNDIILVQAQPAAENGQTVIARLNDGEVTCKRFYKLNGTCRLEPANKNYTPIDSKDVEIIGVVKKVIKDIY